MIAEVAALTSLAADLTLPLRPRFLSLMRTLSLHASWTSLHERLRLETRDLHDTLEVAVDIPEQISTRERYRSYLYRLWSVHTAIEQSLPQSSLSGLGFDYGNRRRSELLEHDLAMLDMPLDSRLGKELPKIAAALNTQDALGRIYVVEGSAIGARAVLPDIQRQLGLSAAEGASFFAGLDVESKPIWRACLDAINAIQADTREADQTVASARNTFQVFLEWLPEPTSQDAK